MTTTIGRIIEADHTDDGIYLRVQRDGRPDLAQTLQAEDIDAEIPDRLRDLVWSTSVPRTFEFSLDENGCITGWRPL